MEQSMIGTILGVAIGIVFVFMLFSLLLSAVLEAVSAALKLRGRALRVAIARMIDDPDVPVRYGGFGFMDQMSRRWGKPAAANAPAALVADPVDPESPEAHEAATETPDGEYLAPLPMKLVAVFRHPLIAGAKEDSKPSYLPPANFSSALTHALLDGGPEMSLAALQARVHTLPAGTLRDAVQTALREAQGDVENFRVGLERWYDHAMGRLSGEYKRFSQLVTFVLGLLLAMSYDINPIAIGQRLYADPVLRQAIEQQASAYVADAVRAQQAAASAAGVAAEPNFDARLKAVEDAKNKLLDTGLLRLNPPDPADDGRRPALTWQQRISAWFGWVLTALAGMLGAPFWFDLLQKLVNLRGAGPKPKTADATTKDK